jgi:murein DD-endopeptidase MepM/ murein hydrolase activator NlpD
VYFKSLYCHLNKGSFRVTPGDNVKTGDIIALADNTCMSTGSHLHFGLKPILPGRRSGSGAISNRAMDYNGAIDPALYRTGTAAVRRYVTHVAHAARHRGRSYL